MAVGKKLRFEVFKRDKFTCVYCGRTPPTVTLEADHLHPASKGGTDEPDNLITACFDCNRGKSDGDLMPQIVPVQVSQDLAYRAERAEQLRQHTEMKLQERAIVDEHARQVGVQWVIKQGANPDKAELNDSIMSSIRRFVKELGVVEVLDSMDIAFSKIPNGEMPTFKYFCGICWKKIKGGQR